jgi:hypothetical protein
MNEVSRESRQLPIIQYWHADTPPDYIVELFETFVEHNPQQSHLVFSESAAERLIAERFGEREVTAFRMCAIPAMQADYFRYCAVLALGGIYSDADFRCAADIRRLIPTGRYGRLFRGPKGNVMNGIFAFGAPGHPFLELALEIATVNIERRISDDVFFTTGPPIFTALAALYGHGSFDALLSHLSESEHRPLVAAYCDAIGDYGRVTHAFEGISIVPVSQWREFILPVERLPYQRSKTHWRRAKGRIFREEPGDGKS